MRILLRGGLVLILTSLSYTSRAHPVSSVSLTVPADVQEAAAYLSFVPMSDKSTRYRSFKALNQQPRRERRGTVLNVSHCMFYKVVAVGFNTLRYDASVGVLNPPHE